MMIGSMEAAAKETLAKFEPHFLDLSFDSFGRSSLSASQNDYIPVLGFGRFGEPSCVLVGTELPTAAVGSS